jgi:hypothetical protein
MMRKLGVSLAIAALAAVVASPPPAAAFGLRIGPLHIGLPFFGYRYRHHPLYMRGNPDELAHPESAQAGRTALLYPNLALSAIFENVFWPADSSAWPFGYQDIFTTAFAPAPAAPDQRLCQRPDDADVIVGRLRGELAPTAEQVQLLQKLGGALGAASGYLAKSCPNTIPTQPTARLQLMGSQVEELTMAVDIIRQPLQDFEQSLSDEQKARFAAMIEAPAGSDRHDRTEIARSCSGSGAAIERSLGQIDQSVQPTDAQRSAFNDMKQAFSQAASDLEAHCPSAVPPTALGRLQASEARLDSTWRAVLSVQVALASFETKLSEEQKSRFNATNFATR